MADESYKNSSIEMLYGNYNTLTKEVQELEVINSELENLRKNSNIYVKRGGGNLFFLSQNHKETIIEYKMLLETKRKDKQELESTIQKRSTNKN